jgi:hypothetical protein
MKFDERWKIAAEAARHAAPAPATEMPFGFATRVVARWRTLPAPTLTALWQAIALRVLGAMLLLLAVLAALDFSDTREGDSWRPAISDTVGDYFWML